MHNDWSNLAESYEKDPKVRKDVVIAKFNCHEAHEFCRKMHIHSYPTIYFYKMNEN